MAAPRRYRAWSLFLFTNRDARAFVRRFCHVERWPDQEFPRWLRASIQGKYPAHLHTNIAAAERRKIVGTRLIARYLADLHAAGVSGVHLEGRRHFLTALALDPANKPAFEALQSEIKETRVIQHNVRKGESLDSVQSGTALLPGGKITGRHHRVAPRIAV
jgi:hypothetical protein